MRVVRQGAVVGISNARGVMRKVDISEMPIRGRRAGKQRPKEWGRGRVCFHVSGHFES